MIPISMKLIKAPPSAAEIFKQMNFGTAKGLTDTAKQGQRAVVDALKDGRFTLRSNWFEQSNRMGIRITPATKTSLQASVQTMADWLEKHEKGGDFGGKSGHRLSVPLFKLRPRGSTKKIPSAMKVKALLASGKAFILNTPKGDVVVLPKGKGASSRLDFLYGLEPKVRVRRQSMFYDPINNVVKRNLDKNIEAGIAYAFKTMRK